MTSKVKPHSTKLKNCVYYNLLLPFFSAANDSENGGREKNGFNLLLLLHVAANNHKPLVIKAP